jgi:hypothetical protein
MTKRRSKVYQICSRTVAVVKEETKPMVNFCIAAARVPAEVLGEKKKRKGAR